MVLIALLIRTGSIWVPIAMVLPNFPFALFLLRKVRNDTRLATD